MHNYRFIGLTPRFYPDERGADGKSLMAMPGDVHDWEHTPDDGLWVLAGEALEPVFPPDADPAPEPPQEAPVVAPVPEAAPPAPEPVPAPVAPAEAVPAPEPAMTANWFAALSNPPARA